MRDMEAVMTFEQIAEELGVNYETARSTYYHAIRKLSRSPEAVKLLQLAAEKDSFNIRARERTTRHIVPFSAMRTTE